jgi:hypothetical protein
MYLTHNSVSVLFSTFSLIDIHGLIRKFVTFFVTFVTSLNYFRPHLRNSVPPWLISDLIYAIRYLLGLFQTSYTGFVTFLDYFRPHLRESLLLDYFWHHLRDSFPRWTISDLIYGIRCLVELFKTSFMGFVISLNYFGPPLRDSLPHWSILDLICWIRYLIELFHIWFGDSLPRCSILDLICGIRYLVKLLQTSFTEFVTSLYYFRPRLRDLLSQWTISDLIYGIRYLNLTQAHRAIWYFIYTYFWGIMLIYFIYELSFTRFITWKFHLISHWEISVTN